MGDEVRLAVGDEEIVPVAALGLHFKAYAGKDDGGISARSDLLRTLVGFLLPTPDRASQIVFYLSFSREGIERGNITARRTCGEEQSSVVCNLL